MVSRQGWQQEGPEKGEGSRCPGGWLDLLVWVIGVGLWVPLPHPQELCHCSMLCDAGLEHSRIQHTSQCPVVWGSSELQASDDGHLSPFWGEWVSHGSSIPSFTSCVWLGYSFCHPSSKTEPFATSLQNKGDINQVREPRPSPQLKLTLISPVPLPTFLNQLCWLRETHLRQETLGRKRISSQTQGLSGHGLDY